MWILEFVIGAIFGSAGNAIIDRLISEKSWFKGRSRCDQCEHVLGVFDLIPIMSFLLLKGKCRYCQSPILVRNLLFEVFMGIAAIVFNIQTFLFVYFIFWLTMIIVVMDWETKLVSEWLIFFWGLLGLWFLTPNIIISNWIGVLVGMGLIGGIWAITKGRAMGFGDVEIAMVMGIWLGWQKVLAAMWIAFVVGAICSLFIIVVKKGRMESVIAFGPFLILGFWMSYFWGQMLIKYFLGYA